MKLKCFQPHPYIPGLRHAVINGMSVLSAADDFKDDAGAPGAAAVYRSIPGFRPSDIIGGAQFEVMDYEGNIHRFNDPQELADFIYKD